MTIFRAIISKTHLFYIVIYGDLDEFLYQRLCADEYIAITALFHFDIPSCNKMMMVYIHSCYVVYTGFFKAF